MNSEIYISLREAFPESDKDRLEEIYSTVHWFYIGHRTLKEAEDAGEADKAVEALGAYIEGDYL